MEKVIGREVEKKLFQEALKSKVPELIDHLQDAGIWQCYGKRIFAEG